MPIAIKRFKKDKNTRGNDAAADNAQNNDLPQVNPTDIHVNEFSDDIDLNGIGNLLSGGIPTTSNFENVENQMPNEQSKDKKRKFSLNLNIGEALKAFADKLAPKKRGGDIPELPKEEQPADPNYVSDTVSFVDFDDSQQMTDNYSPSEENFQQRFDTQQEFTPQPSPSQFIGGDNVGFSADVQSEITGNAEMYVPQYYSEPINPSEDNFGMDFGAHTNDFDGEQNYYEHPTEPNYSAEIEHDMLQDWHVPYENNISEQFDASQEAADDSQPARRSHDIMGAVRARIKQFCKRLPSFKPKEYTIPESSYEPQEDSIKSPSLVADIEKIIKKQSDLGEISREYEDMRQYIRSVDDNLRLSRDEIRAPENLSEVHDAQNELFDMIYQIGVQNEQQRSRIGVYEKRAAEDPYNYRGINDRRQYYSDVEANSFSVESSLSFESTESISPYRHAMEQQYYENEYSPDLDDDFSDDSYGFESSDGSAEESIGYDNFDDGFDDGFDDDLENIPRDDLQYHEARNYEPEENWSDDLGSDDDFAQAPSAKRATVRPSRKRGRNVDYR